VAIKNLYDHRFLIVQLTKVFALSPYKKSFLGGLWLIFFPLITVVIWIFLKGAGIVNPGDTGMPYPVYVLLSTSIWGLFLQLYKSVSQSISNGGKMMMMNKFPHETIIASLTATQLINFTILMLINILVILAFGVELSWTSLLFPFTLIPLILFGMTIGLFVAMLRVIALDICQAIDESMKIIMYLTPIVYAPKVSISWLQPIIDMNPLTYLIGFSRDMLISGDLSLMKGYFICFAFTLVLFPLVFKFYLANEGRVLERLINN
jgi:lipopolysaccharide transport system permease protein